MVHQQKPGMSGLNFHNRRVLDLIWLYITSVWSPQNCTTLDARSDFVWVSWWGWTSKGKYIEEHTTLKEERGLTAAWEPPNSTSSLLSHKWIRKPSQCIPSPSIKCQWLKTYYDASVEGHRRSQIRPTTSRCMHQLHTLWCASFTTRSFTFDPKTYLDLRAPSSSSLAFRLSKLSQRLFNTGHDILHCAQKVFDI